MAKLRRINFYGPSGVGKSSIAAKIFASLKELKYDVEQVQEYIKAWAHEGKKPVSFDQLYIFAKQLHSEDVLLRNVELLVSDSPLMLNAAYSHFYHSFAAQNILTVAQEFDEQFESINFFLTRTVPFVAKGRYEQQEQSDHFGDFLQQFLRKNLRSEFILIDVTKDFSMVIDLIEAKFNDSNS